jgi:hypothetical protein
MLAHVVGLVTVLETLSVILRRLCVAVEEVFLVWVGRAVVGTVVAHEAFGVFILHLIRVPQLVLSVLQVVVRTQLLLRQLVVLVELTDQGFLIGLLGPVQRGGIFGL